MECNSFCNNCNHTSCVEYIPCFGPAGPSGETATNQFLSLGALAATSPFPNKETPITFTQINAVNGTDITAAIPTNGIILSPNHSYKVSYIVNSSANGASALSAGLLLNGVARTSSIASNDGNTFISVSGEDIISVGSSSVKLQLATTVASGTLTLLNANVSITELL